ncbi:hypothetical protein SteCoe_32718 [Stentor coeruleus]|uniref:Uncharacterized protein n=1 Tax=Stentor coeruleus TaxID=5963 RepID=A0A1R2AYJ4_9CILI|nr:hypothetical protein SteCoe_32718 [Stentor coeruleus]
MANFEEEWEIEIDEGEQIEIIKLEIPIEKEELICGEQFIRLVKNKKKIPFKEIQPFDQEDHAVRKRGPSVAHKVEEHKRKDSESEEFVEEEDDD